MTWFFFLIIKDLARQQVVTLPSNSVTKVVLEEEESKNKPQYPKPDVEQMIAFKPRQIVCKLQNTKHLPVLSKEQISDFKSRQIVLKWFQGILLFNEFVIAKITLNER